MMKRLIFLLLFVLTIQVAAATPTNFTEFVAYGDAWKATNDTHTIVMWNQTGHHVWLSTGNATDVTYFVVAGGGGGGAGGLGGGGGAGGAIFGTTSVTGIVNISVGWYNLGESDGVFLTNGRCYSVTASKAGYTGNTYLKCVVGT